MLCISMIVVVVENAREWGSKGALISSGSTAVGRSQVGAIDTQAQCCNR